MDREAIEEIIEAIMSHSENEIGLDQYHADALRSVLNENEKYSRRVVEYLRGNDPAPYRGLAATFGGDWGLTMDGVLKAKDDGLIDLVEGYGKYRLVGDKKE